MLLHLFPYFRRFRRPKENPDAVSVTEVEGEQELTLELRVASEDMGKVIGRQGRIAKEIRTLVRSCAQRSGRRVSVDIVD